MPSSTKHFSLINPSKYENDKSPILTTPSNSNDTGSQKLTIVPKKASDKGMEKKETFTTGINYLKRKDRIDDIALPESRLRMLEVTNEMLGGRIRDISEPGAEKQAVRLGLLRDVMCGPIITSNSTAETDISDVMWGPIKTTTDD
jgi:hypothetical protein